MLKKCVGSPTNKHLSASQSSPLCKYENTLSAYGFELEEVRNILSTAPQRRNERFSALVSLFISPQAQKPAKMFSDPSNFRIGSMKQTIKCTRSKSMSCGPMVSPKPPKAPYESAFASVLTDAAERHLLVGHSTRPAGPTCCDQMSCADLQKLTAKWGAIGYIPEAAAPIVVQPSGLCRILPCEPIIAIEVIKLRSYIFLHLSEGNDGPWSTFDIHVGAPPQPVRVLVSFVAEQTWVVSANKTNGGCLATDPSSCAQARGGLFSTNLSTTWQDKGIWGLGIELNLEDYLHIDDAWDFGFDAMGLGLAGAGGIRFESQTIAAIATKDYYLGYLGLNRDPLNCTDYRVNGDPLIDYNSEVSFLARFASSVCLFFTSTRKVPIASVEPLKTVLRRSKETFSSFRYIEKITKIERNYIVD